jgi:mycothiol synthase
MSSSLPDGFTVRPLTDDDAEVAANVTAAYDEATIGMSELTAADVRDFWKLVDLPTNSWLAEADGRPAAVATAFEHNGLLDVDAYVHPDFQGRGLGAWLLMTTEERARELALPGVHSATLAADARGRTLFERHGYRDVRHFYRMVIDLDRDFPAPVWPDGLRVATFQPEDARAFHAALQESFEDEWNFRAETFERWKERRVSVPDMDPTVWWLVWDGEEVAAVLRGESERMGYGWIGALGVRKPSRGRGIGLALLLTAFAEFRRRGRTQAGLGVDAQNPTGATRLYERAGMRVAWEAIVFRKDFE